eukprot:408750_1
MNILVISSLITSGYAASCKNYNFDIYGDDNSTGIYPVGQCYAIHKSPFYPFSYGFECEEINGSNYAVEYYYSSDNCDQNGIKAKISEAECNGGNDFCECTLNK